LTWFTTHVTGWMLILTRQLGLFGLLTIALLLCD
jgi:hypothetical protein